MSDHTSDTLIYIEVSRQNGADGKRISRGRYISLLEWQELKFPGVTTSGIIAELIRDIGHGS